MQPISPIKTMKLNRRVGRTGFNAVTKFVMVDETPLKLADKKAARSRETEPQVLGEE